MHTHRPTLYHATYIHTTRVYTDNRHVNRLHSTYTSASDADRTLRNAYNRDIFRSRSRSRQKRHNLRPKWKEHYATSTKWTYSASKAEADKRDISCFRSGKDTMQRLQKRHIPLQKRRQTKETYPASEANTMQRLTRNGALTFRHM